jgi:hypothetical protein
MALTVTLPLRAALSVDTVNRAMLALTSQQAGRELVNAANSAASAAVYVSAVVLDANASATTNLTAAQLLVGDIVVNLTTVANNVIASMVVATAGTIAYTPTDHDCLVVLRAVPAATTQTL